MDIRCSAVAALLLGTLTLVACGDKDEKPGDSPGSGAAQSFDASPEAMPQESPGAVDPFTGDCDSARWADVSEACWACLCEGCRDTLNACEDGCIELMQCALEKDTLVGDIAEIGCEVRATRALCLPEGAEDTWQRAASFDTCLITATPKPEGQFRICEAECGIAYTGDVCARYPE
jgi:hypothetical protein